MLCVCLSESVCTCLSHADKTAARIKAAFVLTCRFERIVNIWNALDDDSLCSQFTEYFQKWSSSITEGQIADGSLTVY